MGREVSPSSYPLPSSVLPITASEKDEDSYREHGSCRKRDSREGRGYGHRGVADR